VILNFSCNGYSDYRMGFPDAGMWKIRFNSDWDGYDNDFGDFTTLDTEAFEGECDGQPFNANVAIAPYSAVVLSQDR
jgi:1,4-alpha-glucan branching enzyme